MKPLFVRGCRVFWIAAVAFGFEMGVGRAKAEDPLEIENIDGKDYVPLASLKPVYHFDRLTLGNEKVTLENKRTSIDFTIGSTDCELNGLKFHLAQPVAKIDDRVLVSKADLAGLLDPALRPSAASVAGDFKTVILDLAGSDEGKNAILSPIAANVRKELEAQGFTVVLTQAEGEPLDATQRRDMANRVSDEALFISIGIGSGPEDKSGIETTALSSSESDPADAARKNLNASGVSLGTAIHGSLIRRLGKNTKDGGIGLEEIKGSQPLKHPAVSITVGYLSNAYESKLLADARYHDALAKGISEGIKRYQAAALFRHRPGATPPDAQSEGESSGLKN